MYDRQGHGLFPGVTGQSEDHVLFFPSLSVGESMCEIPMAVPQEEKATFMDNDWIIECQVGSLHAAMANISLLTEQLM